MHPQRFEPRTVQPVASRYTEYVILDPCKETGTRKCLRKLIHEEIRTE